MRVFVTGATGFVGSAVVRELIAAGHQVLGLSRSDTGAAALEAAGAEVLRGTLEDLDSLRSGTSDTDATIHTAFLHDFTNYAKSAEIDRQAIEAMGTVLAGSNRPFIVTSGMAGFAPDRAATEDDPANPRSFRFSEATAEPFVERGVRVVIMRLSPSVHDKDDHGFVPMLIEIARSKGVSAYLGDGNNRWPAVHRADTARLYRLALENPSASLRLHAVGDAGVPTRQIAEAIGQRYDLPVVSLPVEQAGEHFGWMSSFLATDIFVSSALTQQRLGWKPTEIGLLEDIERNY